MVVGVNIPHSTGGFDEKTRTAVIALILVGLLSIPGARAGDPWALGKG